MSETSEPVMIPAKEAEALRYVHRRLNDSKPETPLGTGFNCIAPAADPDAIRRWEEAQARWELAAKLDRCRNAWLMAKVPSHFALATLDKFPDGLPDGYVGAAAALLKLVEAPTLTALVGPHGTGKTYMACGLIRAFCMAGKSALYCRALDFFTAIKSTFGAAAKHTQEDVQAIYHRPSLLVIDEIDLRSDTPWEDVMLGGGIDWRYMNNRATVIISNKNARELRERLGPRVSDRFRDQGGGIIVCDWGSLRGRFS